MTRTSPDPLGGSSAHVREPTRFAEWNEDMVRRYDIDRYYERSHPFVRWVERRRLAALTALASPRSEERVLEVGCGAGHVLRLFAGKSCTGVDLSPTMLSKARTRLGARFPLVQAAAEGLPFPDGAFDVVLCTEVLEHTLHPERVTAELLRVAGPTGRVVLSVPNERNIDRAKAILRLPGLRRVLATLADEGNEWHLHRMDLAALRSLAHGRATIERIRAVPARILPLRYVALLRSGGEP